MFGRVISPARILYARVPGMALVSAALQFAEQYSVRLEPSLKLLIKHYVAFLNGCSFCMDLAQALAIQQHIAQEKFESVAVYQHSTLFTERERAALRYAEEIAERRMNVTEDVFAELQRFFDDREIVEITYLCATEQYYNSLSLPLGLSSDGLCSIAAQAHQVV